MNPSDRAGVSGQRACCTRCTADASDRPSLLVGLVAVEMRYHAIAGAVLVQMAVMLEEVGARWMWGLSNQSMCRPVPFGDC